ncbi:MAG: class E sortase [Actinobacteria bacterium]|nr:class E sortase [Actinomycetota bacterium]MBV9256314.1 class E sortase [Actinomycetota bacterium]MBV9663725.1 class E sortase [Actinomycetota bacterium]MBV9935026.1 class E sortase [Actinomycetota bacterium]
MAGAGGQHKETRQEGVPEKANLSAVTRGPRALIVMLAVGVLISGIGALWLRGSGDAVHAALPVSVGQPTITTTSTSTSTTAPPQAAHDAVPHKPINPPAQAYAQEPIIQIGTIEIPKIGLVSPIYHGITMRNIDLGPSHWPGTAFPGENGNAVFAGHRVTHTHPFLHIDQLVNGDLVYFTVQGVRTTYTVTGHEIVKPTELRITDQTPTPTATLFGCHPPHFATYRYVVHLALVADQ